jgi:hypothetical protein
MCTVLCTCSRAHTNTVYLYCLLIYTVCSSIDRVCVCVCHIIIHSVTSSYILCTCSRALTFASFCHIYMYIYMHVCIYIYIYDIYIWQNYTHTLTHTHTHTYTHTHTHTHTPHTRVEPTEASLREWVDSVVRLWLRDGVALQVLKLVLI